MPIVLLIALLAVVALAAWEREHTARRHRDERDELQARIDALVAATTTIPGVRRAHSDINDDIKQVKLHKSSNWYDSKPDVQPMRVLDDEELAHPTKKAGT